MSLLHQPMYCTHDTPAKRDVDERDKESDVEKYYNAIKDRCHSIATSPLDKSVVNLNFDATVKEICHNQYAGLECDTYAYEHLLIKLQTLYITRLIAIRTLYHRAWRE